MQMDPQAPGRAGAPSPLRGAATSLSGRLASAAGLLPYPVTQRTERPDLDAITARPPSRRSRAKRPVRAEPQLKRSLQSVSTAPECEQPAESERETSSLRPPDRSAQITPL